jgi:hypothetical protein
MRPVAVEIITLGPVGRSELVRVHPGRLRLRILGRRLVQFFQFHAQIATDQIGGQTSAARLPACDRQMTIKWR